MSGAFPRFGVIEGGLSRAEIPAQSVSSMPVTRGIAGGGGGPHDPGMEVRMSVLEAKMAGVEVAVNRLEGRIDGLDVRLRGVEVSIGRLEGKIDALIGTIVGQTSAALAKLPSWWQMPAVIGSTVALLAILGAGYRYLVTHGLL
jgi:hypothetical protein